MDLVTEIPVSRFEFKKLIVSYYSNGILHVYVKPDTVIDLTDLGPVTDYVSSIGPKKFLNLFEFAVYSSTDDNVRKWASDPAGNTRTIADAIVLKGLDQKLIADFYLKFNAPIKPTQLFNNVKEAADWLLTQV